jgi:hypothetical protein
LQCQILYLGLTLLLAKHFYCVLEFCLGCSFLFDLLLHYLRSPGDCPSLGHMLLHEAKAFILLVKVCQLVFNERFNFNLGILLLVLLGFDVLVLL